MFLFRLFCFVGSSRYVSTIFSVFIITRASVPLHGWMARSFSLAGIGVFISDFCVFVIFLFLCWLFSVRRSVRPVRSFFFIHHAVRAFLRLRFDNNLFSVSLQGQMSVLLCIFVFCFGVGPVRYVFPFGFRSDFVRQRLFVSIAPLAWTKRRVGFSFLLPVSLKGQVATFFVCVKLFCIGYGWLFGTFDS